MSHALLCFSEFPGFMAEENREPNATDMGVDKGQDSCQLEDLETETIEPPSTDADDTLQISQFSKVGSCEVPEEGGAEVNKETTQKDAHTISSSSAAERQR